MLTLAEAALALAALAAFFKPSPWARAALSAGPLIALLQGAFVSPLYVLLPLAFTRDRWAFLHGFLLYLATALSPNGETPPPWTLSLFLTAGLLMAGSRHALPAATLTLFLRVVSGASSGNLWSWDPLDIALASLWLTAWAHRHVEKAPRIWCVYGVLAPFFEGAGGLLLTAVSVISAVWEFGTWRPPFSPLGISALGGSLLVLLAVGSSAWLHKAGLGIFGNVFIDMYGPVLGAAALGGIAAFVLTVGGIRAALPILLFFASSALMYAIGVRIYPDSSVVTNLVMPALAASSLYAAGVAIVVKRATGWRAAHAVVFLVFALLSISGPYMYNPSYVKFVIAVPGSVVWTLEPPPYPAKVELSSVVYQLDDAPTWVEGCGAVPRGVLASLELAVDGERAVVTLRYGVEEALGLKPPLGLGLVGDHLVIVGPVYGEGGATQLSRMYWNMTGGCLGRDGEAPEEYIIGVRPLPLFRLAISLLVVATAFMLMIRRR